MCARELLTLGQNCDLRLQNFEQNKHSRIVFDVPSHSSKVYGQQFIHNPELVSTIPNLDGNFSESSDSGGESDSENFSVCMNRDLTEKDRVKKLMSGSKSTVEGSCPLVVSKSLINKEKKKLWKKVKRNDKFVPKSDEHLMVGETPPDAPLRLKPSRSKSGELGQVTGKTKSEINNSSSEGIINQVYGTTQCRIKVCDSTNSNSEGLSKMNLNNVTSLGLPVNQLSQVSTSNIITLPHTSLSGTPTCVCVSNLSSGGQIVAVAGMNLGSTPPLLVFSSGGNYNTGSFIGNFPGGMPMTLIPGGGNKTLIQATQLQAGQLNIQSSEVLKVPVGVTNSQGGLVAITQHMGTLTQTSSFTHSSNTVTTPAPTIQGMRGETSVSFEDKPVVREARIEPTIQEDGSILWSCNVCAKICPSEGELKIHKKRHKIDEALICPYCKRSYVDQHRYAVHVRIHTGETPFHCELCGKGFRDDRKMKLHMARHNSGLSHKCHLCPRSFEGPKALEKHLNAHATGRYVAPKVIQKSDGTTAMALPEDKQKDAEMPNLTSEISRDVEPSRTAPSPHMILGDTSHFSRISEGLSFDLKSEGSQEDDSVSASSSMISLSMDDIYQYNVNQTAIETPSNPDSLDIQEKLTEGAARVVPLDMDEFMTGGSNSHQKIKDEHKPQHNDSGEFPDLLDSSNSLANLNSNYNYSHHYSSTTDEKLDSFFKAAGSIKEESGLTFTTLDGLKPDYPDIEVPSFADLKPSGPIVVAKRSVVPMTEVKLDLELGNQVELDIKTGILPDEIKREPAPILEVTASSPVQTMVANDSSLSFPAQFYPSAQPSSSLTTPVEVNQELITKQETPIVNISDLSASSLSLKEEKDLIPTQPSAPAPKPLEPLVQKDPVKETYTVITEGGLKVEVPTIITGGYDFDNLLCLFCEKQQFKNDKTLINHLLSHFGVAPKMATCPICHLSLQKKSFARHVRLHGDVQPEVCPYCKKEFREKRSLEKHVRAIHEAERPFPCDQCSEAFRNQIELKNHKTRHLKDHPFKCDTCPMSFQKQEALTTHYRLHTGEKPFACNFCDKKFTSEKNRRVHVLRHEGSLPHKCEDCDMTFQSRSHLIKHATSHTRKTQDAVVDKIHTFLESFGASLGEFGLDDTYDSNDQISLHPASESGEIEDHSVKLSMETFSETKTLEAAAASATIPSSADTAFFDLTEDTDSQDEMKKSGNFSSSSVPSLVNGLSEEDAERMARAELDSEIPPTADGTHLCQMCNTRLGNKRSYIIHLRRHAGMLNFRCNYCPKTFQGRVKLNRHMNTHLRDGALPPVMAKPEFTRKDPVPGPSMVQEKPGFCCNQCSKICPDKASLQEHTKMHLIEDAKAKFSTTPKEKKPDAPRLKYSYTCNLCNMTFVDNERWKSHKTAHGNKTWKCRSCGDLFEDKSILSSHLKHMHNINEVESERLGYLKPIPLVIIKAVPPEVLQKPKEEKKGVDDSSSEDSEDEVPDPLPKLYDDELGPPVLSRSGSSVSLESPGLVFDQRPSSACTDNSDISTGPEFITPLSDTDESQFDVASLTCRICNKTLKNLRTFRNHRARHLGILNHKCPDCSKCFEGRSAVNRHLISNHNRELLPHEITTNPAAAAGANVCKPTSGVKIFKPSDMARKPFQSTESPGKVAEIAVPGLSTVTRGEKGKSDDSLFDMVREGKTVVPPASGQMPILLENPAPQPVKYIVGSQLRNDENSCSDTDSLNRFEREDRSHSPDLEEPVEKLDEISHKQSLDKSKEEFVTTPEVEKLEEIPKETENKETIEPAPVDEPKTLPPEIANMEKIIPESDSDSDSDSSSSSSSSDSDSSSDEGEKENDDKPEEILIDDDDNIPENPIPDSPKKGDQYLDAFQNFLTKSTDKGAKAEEERVSPEVKKSTPRRTLTQVIEISPVDDIMSVLSPPELEDQTEDSKSSEKNEPALKPKEKMKVIPGARRKPVSGAKNKVSMVARIFRAKKKDEVKNEAKKSDSMKPKALEKPKKISPRRLRKSSSEDSDRLESESTDDSRQDAEMQAEADKLLEKKGVSVIGGKLMIPADKLKIPDELCKIKLVGKANKRHFCCEICDKSYNRADKMKYHLYNDHYEDFIRCSDSVPRILKKSFPAKLDVKGVLSKTGKEKSVSKPSALARIFKKKEPKKDATPPKRSPRERKISEKDEGSKLSSILVDPGSPVESTSDTMDAHSSDLEDLGRSKLRGKSSPETSRSDLQERSVKSRSRQKSEKTSPFRSGKLRSGDNFDRSASPQKNKSPEKSNKKSPIKQERPESPEKLHPSILTDKVISPEQLEMIKSPEKTSSLRSPEKQDRITLVKLDKLKSPVQSVPINSEEINQFFESENTDLEPSILEPITPILPKPVVQKKRGRKKKSETDIEDSSEDTGKTRTRKGSSFLEPVNFDISSLEGSSRRTRAMSEENLTPPEIIQNTSMTPEKWDGSGQVLKSGLRTEFSPRSLVKLKVTFDLPEASYDADGNEIVKEKKKKLVESSPTRFPKSVEEPKFGMNKDFVTFADLALKSKCQVELMEKENSILKPVVTGRKKVSARLSLEQSNIEDTPELTALQAIKEDEKKENEAIANNLPVPIENSTEIQDKEPITEEKETPVSDEEDEDISDDLPESLKILLGEGSEMKEDESRPTRSKLHVDTIGLSSSTLDLELHALRNLVFNEILKQKYDSGEDQRSESRTSVSAVSADETKPCNEVKKDIKEENILITEEQTIKSLDEEEPLTQFLECIKEEKPLSRVERFIQIGKNFQKAIPKFRSFLWHERKRLRILKSAEFRELRDKQPIEKQKKYKPKRHDYSLEILCKNNLYDNVVFNTREMIEKNFRLTDKVLRRKPFHPIFYRKYSVLKKENELKMILRRKPKSYFSCIANCNELKISLKKEIKEKKAESECKNEVSPVQPKASSEVLQEHETPKAIPGPKKRGRKPKSFKETALVEEKINSAKMLIENDCVKEGNTSEPSPKRARKGRPKKAMASPQALKMIEPQPPLIQPNQEKELDSSVPIGETKSNNSAETGRSSPVKEAHQSQTLDQDIDISSPKLKLDLPVDKSDEMTGENSANRQELVKIQTAAVSDPSEHIFSAEENRFGRKAKKRKEVLEKTEKIKFKKCKISESLSSDEDQQVPLKITFNRSSKKEDGSINKSIKLRVKTKTTSDHGFNIQIEQPKTDNPVKFKLKTSAELIKRSKRGGKSLEDIAGKLALLSQTKSAEVKDLKISNDEKSGSSKFTKLRISSRNEKPKNPIKAPEVTIQNPKVLIEEPKITAVESKISTKESKVSVEDTKVSVDESKVSIEEPMVPEKESEVSVSDSKVSMNGLEVSVEHSNVSIDKSSVLTDRSKVLAEESKVSGDKSMVSGGDPKISVDVSTVSPEVSKVSDEFKILDEESKVSAVVSKVLTKESKVLEITKDLFKSEVSIKEISRKVPEVVAKSFKESTDEPKVSKEESKVSPEKLKISADQSETSEAVSEVLPENSKVLAEESKISAEESEVSAEESKVSAEESEVSVEEPKVSADESKVSAEESKVSAEESEVSAEESKVSAEESKVSAEEPKVSAEEPKVSKENTTREEPMEMKTSISSTAAKSSTNLLEKPEINAELSARAAPPAPSGESKQTFSETGKAGLEEINSETGFSSTQSAENKLNHKSSAADPENSTTEQTETDDGMNENSDENIKESKDEVPESLVASKELTEEIFSRATSIVQAKSNIIPQCDGFDESDLSESDSEDLQQIDGNSDVYRPARLSPRTIYKLLTDSYKSIQVVTTTQSPSAPGATRNPGDSNSSSSNPSSSVNSAQIKRDRSASEDSSDGGDQNNKKKHQCHICSKLFPNSFRLKTHVRVHTGEKPFKCEPCSQAFADRSNFVKHKQTKIHKSKAEPKLEQTSSMGQTMTLTEGGRIIQSSVVTTVRRNSIQSVLTTVPDRLQEVPQFEFIDSPLNQHDLDSHVPVDGYDTDDSIPMTLDDMDDMSPAAENMYMFSSQVDGEQDFLESSPNSHLMAISPSQMVNGGSHRMNGTSQPHSISTGIKIEHVQGQITMNGDGTSSDSSILARQLSLGVVNKTLSDTSTDKFYSCEMCSAKLKNKRNFETHMKRHRGELPFKCDECPKTFQGRRDLETHKRSRHDPSRRGRIETDLSMIMSKPATLTSNVTSTVFTSSPSTESMAKTVVLGMNGFSSNFISDSMNTVLIKQDPVMVGSHKDEPPDPEDFMLQDTLPLFENSLMEPGDSSVSLSLDDLASFAPSLEGHSLPGGHDQSFDDGAASFLSGTDMSHDAFDLVGDSTSDGYSRNTPSIADLRSESGITSPFTPRSGSGTPSLPDEGEYPCSQCDKRFGNRRNLMSHMRRHTGDYKLFCEDCGKGFFTQSKLDSHKRKHTGEKPFRCLFKTCLKRFRYKGDLSKHIKRYHPGHSQALTPVPLQEDELIALENAQQAAKHKTLTTVTTINSDSSTLRTVLTTGTRPSHIIIPSMQPPVSSPSFTIRSNSNPGTIIPDPDPSLDENLLNMLAADGDDDVMLSPTARTLAGLTSSVNGSIDTSLVLPNTVFSSKPVNQDVGYLQLMSSGKSTILQSNDTTKQVFFHIADGSGSIQRPVLKGKNIITSFALPQTSHSTFKTGITLSASSATSSQTLRTLLSTSREPKIIRMPFVKTLSPAPVYSRNQEINFSSASSVNLLSTTFTPSSLSSKPILSHSFSTTSTSSLPESFLPADISFTSDSSRESQPGVTSETMTLSLEDLLSYARIPSGKSDATKSDRESDLTSPGSVRSVVSEIDMNPARSEDMEVGEKFICKHPNCGKTFDRANLLKRHLKMHSGECRFVCDVCKKCFESNSKLEDHYRRHTGERPFQCYVCGNKFRYKGDRTKHLKNLHGIYKTQDDGVNGSAVLNEILSPDSMVNKPVEERTILSNSDSTNSSVVSSMELDVPFNLDPGGSKPDPLDVSGPSLISISSAPGLPARMLSCSLPQETVSMSLDEVLQYAQPISDYSL